MKRILSYIFIIIALMFVIAFIYVKVNHSSLELSSEHVQVNEAPLSEVTIDTIYLYHGEEVLQVDRQEPVFQNVIDMAVNLEKSALDSGDLIDGSLTFAGGGEKMNSNSGKYYLELDLKEPTNFKSKNTTYKNIRKVVFDVREYCFYLYDSEKDEQTDSIAGFGYMDSAIKDELVILMNEQFSINIQKYFDINLSDSWNVEFQNHGTYAFLSYEGEEKGTFELNEIENITTDSLLYWVGGMHGYQEGEEEISEKDGYQIMKLVVSFEQTVVESEKGEAAPVTQIHYFYTKSDSDVVGDLCFQKDAVSEKMMDEILESIIIK